MSESQSQYIMKIGFQSIVNTLVVSPSLDEDIDYQFCQSIGHWAIGQSATQSVGLSVCLSTYQTVSEFVRY